MKNISKRVINFKEHLIKTIPRKPNNKETLKLIQDKSLTDILIIYLNWAARIVPARKRRVIIEPALTADKRWRSISSGVNSLLEKVRKSEELTPHLSLKSYKEGFCPLEKHPDGKIDSWSDKDLLLNVMGYHHFHLGIELEKAGHVKRTDDVLFAEVTREEFIAIGLFNHSVFEGGRESAELTLERKKLWVLFDERSSRGIPPGSVYMPYSIASSGHRTDHVMQAIRYADIIRQIDAKLDDPSYLSEIFGVTERAAVARLKPKWHLNHSDLGVLDERTSSFCVFSWGRI